MRALVALFVLVCGLANANEFQEKYSWEAPDWSRESRLPESGNRSNIYNLNPTQLAQAKAEGYISALRWPVKTTGLLIPFEPLRFFMEAPKKNALRRLVEKLAKKKLGYTSMDGLYEWLGLYKFPEPEDQGVFKIPYPDGFKPDYRMGASLLNFPEGKMLTFSCAACHFGEFLGKVVPGLTNKRPRANEIFHMAKTYLPKVPSTLFKVATRATEDERLIFKRTQKHLKAIGVIRPQVLGLDTSLPHTALSLARRNQDSYATFSSKFERRPRANKLDKFVADSKPMPWFTLKYKTRWLSDGSIVAGNPILTNFLWNEIGRGSDLKQLEKWMLKNLTKIKETTAAVFASEAPKWTDFFPADSINIDLAKRGETVFNTSCKKCHGQYQKAWSLGEAENLSLKEKLETVQVRYPKVTKVKDVGTDPNRYQATEAFAENLNRLAISKWMGTVIVPQEGYVPPPLNGIFSRYPYFHNNSIPNLCALMMKVSDRPKVFYQGPSKKAEDYDRDCVGYPVGEDIPREWLKETDAKYVTGKPGMKNSGHERMFYKADGSERISSSQKRALLEYLKTL